MLDHGRHGYRVEASRSHRSGTRPRRRIARWLAALAAAAVAIGWPAAATAQVYEIVHAFTVPSFWPSGDVIRGTDGAFYGTTQRGGGSSAGTVYRIDTAGVLTTLHTFSNFDGGFPAAGLVQGTDGSFYGTCAYGGATGNGTAFKVDGSGNFTLLHSFSSAEGTNPSGRLIQAAAPDGKFYGTTQYGGTSFANAGTVFKMDSAGTVTTVYSFAGSDGDLPEGGVIQATDGNFYGTTASGGLNGLGTVFQLTAGGTLTTLYAFAGSDGVSPQASLVQASDTKLYGTTNTGGSSSNGTVFRIDTAGTLNTIHNFTGTDGSNPVGALIQATDGKLYGVTYSGGSGSHGTAYRVDTTVSGGFASLHSFNNTEGAEPDGGMAQGTDGNLYAGALDGGANGGGANGGGTFFRMDTSGNVVDKHDFGGASQGYEPEAGVIQASDGNFYGATYRGGSSAMGTIFKMDALGNVTVLHNFTGIGTDGANPGTTLVQANDGKLYGTTANGGTSGLGTVFRIDTAGTLTTLHSFNDTDGVSPAGSMIQAIDGKLYGMTTYGGNNEGGTVYRVDTTTSGNFTSFHAFAGGEGANPMSGLFQASDGTFYGTNSAGGTNFAGTAFRMTTGGAVTTLHNFAGGADGTFPFGRLVLASDGNYYGTTRIDGTGGDGTVFRMTPAGVVTTIHNFSGGDGSSPQADLYRAADGFLYGTTYGGGASGQGTLFKIDTSGNLTTLHHFSGFDGGGPAAPVTQATDGKIYGTANQGGPGASGVVFRESPCLPPVASSNSPVCLGGSLQLSASAIPGAAYAWTGPNGFTSALQNPTIASVTSAAAGTYSVTATVGACTSAPAMTTVAVLPCLVTPAALAVDAAGNGVLEPGETVIASPSWRNPGGSPRALTGTATGFTGPPGATYGLPDASANYGTIAAGATASCASNCYTVSVSNPATRPVQHWDAALAESVSSGDSKSWAIHIGKSFSDVPTSSGFYRFVETIFHGGVTGGCGGTTYCPSNNVSRQQMAVFLLVSREGAGYAPPACATPVFTDVPCSSGFAKWIDELSNRGVTAGCGGGNYCPLDSVTRAQMSVFLLRTLEGSAYTPPACVTPTFADVPCSNAFARWIDELALRGITGGCGGGNYCPSANVTRGQMAVFLTTTFTLTLYGP